MYTWHSVHYVPLKYPFLLSLRHRHRCSRFPYMKHSGLYHPAYPNPGSLQMQWQQRFGRDALYSRREEGVYAGQLNHLPSVWTQMLAE